MQTNALYIIDLGEDASIIVVLVIRKGKKVNEHVHRVGLRRMMFLYCQMLF